jgi:hypothetical protein
MGRSGSSSVTNGLEISLKGGAGYRSSASIGAIAMKHNTTARAKTAEIADKVIIVTSSQILDED